MSIDFSANSHETRDFTKGEFRNTYPDPALNVL